MADLGRPSNAKLVMDPAPRVRQLIVVGPTPPPTHGVAVMTLEVISALKQLDCFAGHLDTRDPRPLSTIGRLDLMNVVLGLRHAGRLWRMLTRHTAADVYLPISQSTWGFARDAVFVGVAKARGRRIILHLHGGHLQKFYLESAPCMRWLIRRVLREADEAWALTPSLKAQFAGFVDEHRVHAVENVVSDPLENGAIPFDPDPSVSFKLLYLANLLPEKGCFELTSALCSLGDMCGDWEVRLVGEMDRDVEERIRHEITLLGDRGPIVKLTGSLHGADKTAQLRWADGFVYPTYYPFEGQPLVLLEALGSGLPIISTRHAGIPETVRDGVDGLLIDPRDTRGLAAALLRLSREHATRAALGSAARERYEANYRPERLVRDLGRLTRCAVQ
jgi:glycosyltransferase involved in cell wall biosynthesis